jgi:hypothetical protein
MEEMNTVQNSENPHPTGRQTISIMRGTLIGVATIVVLSSCAQETTTDQAQTSGNKPEDSTINGAKAAYEVAYGCPVDVNVTSLDLSSQSTKTEDGGNRSTIERADRGWIQYDPVNQVTNIRDTILHAMTHACKAEPMKLQTPITLSDGAVVTGIDGFSLEVDLPGEGESKFTKIEEGFAEALAYALDKNYSTTDPSYHGVGSLSIEILIQLSTEYGIVPRDIAAKIQNNDLNWLVGILVRTEDPDKNDLEQVMTWYQRAFNNNEEVDKIISEIPLFK